MFSIFNRKWRRYLWKSRWNYFDISKLISFEFWHKYSIEYFKSSSFEVVQSMPARPPPRPILPTNSISPEKIFVCLYDHHPTSSDPRELEFKCGDLLYIVNTDGPNFYVGHRLTLPFNEHNQPSKGLVYREFIANAYEKLL